MIQYFVSISKKWFSPSLDPKQPFIGDESAERCYHNAVVQTAALMQRFGDSFPFSSVRRYFLCGACGS